MAAVAHQNLLSNETIDWAVTTAEEVRDGWNQGEDQLIEIDQLIGELRNDSLLLETDVVNNEIRSRATNTLRSLSTLYRRDRDLGLISGLRSFDDTALSNPDTVELLVA